MSDTTDSSGRKTAGAFDVRTIIGALLGIYGVILLLTGLIAGSDADKAGGVNSNLWAGLALLLVAAVFLVWWKLRPIVVPADDERKEVGPPPGH
jgi:hypothetical protein